MNNPIKKQLMPLCAAMSLATGAAAAIPVIPGGTGFGIETVAGRGGSVYRVTTLNPSGPGSLKACVSAVGPRVCVFEVSGVIRLSENLVISSPRITIAGQTAPAPGIMLRGAALTIKASDVLVQHISIRVGDDATGPLASNRDALQIDSPDVAHNVVIDHCSISWAIDENLSLTKNWDNVTISNSILAEPLQDSILGKPQGYNSLIHAVPGKVSFIGNLLAHTKARNPLSRAGELVFVNNVVYNSVNRNVELQMHDGSTISPPTLNSIVGNVFLEGPDSLSGSKFKSVIVSDYVDGARLFVGDNAAFESTSDPWSVVDNTSGTDISSMRASAAPTWPAGLVARETASDGVLNAVLKSAGSRPAERNSVDARIVQDVRNRTGHYINCVSPDGTERCRRNAGGWPQLAENSRKLNLPSSPSADDDGDGYTNLEELLHEMAKAVESAQYVQPEPPGELIVR